MSEDGNLQAHLREGQALLRSGDVLSVRRGRRDSPAAFRGADGTAGTAAEAVRIFDRVRPPFDLLLTDVVLPDRPGPELYGALARRVPGLPVILMSGYSEAALERKGAGLEGAEFLPKPFSPDQLKIVIYRAMASSRAAAPPPEDRLQEPGSG